MECNKTFLWFRVDFIALRYSTVIVILCNKNIDILQHNVLVVCTVSQSGEGFIRFASATRPDLRWECRFTYVQNTPIVRNTISCSDRWSLYMWSRAISYPVKWNLNSLFNGILVVFYKCKNVLYFVYLQWCEIQFYVNLIYIVLFIIFV